MATLGRSAPVAFAPLAPRFCGLITDNLLRRDLPGCVGPMGMAWALRTSLREMLTIVWRRSWIPATDTVLGAIYFTPTNLSKTLRRQVQTPGKQLAASGSWGDTSPNVALKCQLLKVGRNETGLHCVPKHALAIAWTYVTYPSSVLFPVPESDASLCAQGHPRVGGTGPGLPAGAGAGPASRGGPDQQRPWRPGL